MRKFDLKQGWLVANGDLDGDHPGRIIYPEPMQMSEPGWAERTSRLQRTKSGGMSAEGRQNWQQGEVAARPECEVSEEEYAAAREWLAHVEAGRIGSDR